MMITTADNKSNSLNSLVYVNELCKATKVLNLCKFFYAFFLATICVHADNPIYSYISMSRNAYNYYDKT